MPLGLLDLSPPQQREPELELGVPVACFLRCGVGRSRNFLRLCRQHVSLLAARVQEQQTQELGALFRGGMVFDMRTHLLGHPSERNRVGAPVVEIPLPDLHVEPRPPVRLVGVIARRSEEFLCFGEDRRGARHLFAADEEIAEAATEQ